VSADFWVSDSQWRIPFAKKQAAMRTLLRWIITSGFKGRSVDDIRTFEEAMDHMGWHVDTDAETGDVVSIDYVEEPSSNFDEMLRSIAAFVDDGSYITTVWDGQAEEDTFLRHVFTRGEVTEVRPTISWDSLPEG